MGTLFTELGRRVGRNARREIETYEREVPEYRAMRDNPRAREETLEYSVWLRQRTVALAPDNRPLDPADLSFIASMGRVRGEQGVALASHRRVVSLHTNLMLGEIHEAAGLDDTGALMTLMSWFAPQGTNGIEAYVRGYAEGQKHRLSLTSRVQVLTRALLADEPTVSGLARGVGTRLHPCYAVTVLRLPDRPGAGAQRRGEIVGTLWRRHDGTPLTWHEAGELIALVPVAPSPPDGPRAGAAGPADERVLAFVRDAAEALGRPCATGTCTGRVGALADALAQARHISRVSPLQNTAHRPHTMADVFAELGASSLPQVDAWLYGLARQLSRGPALIPTLDAYYRNDLHRVRTATTLNIHPRTLDYRLRRVRELTGVDPCSTHGVRALSTAVTRALTGLWDLR